VNLVVAIANRLPAALRVRMLFRAGTASTPLMSYIRPRLVTLTPERIVIRVDVTRRSRNPFGSMFLGALATAADCAAGAFTMKFMFDTGLRVLPLVRVVEVQCLRKVSRHAHFSCSQGREIFAACRQALATDMPQELPVAVVVTAPAEFGDEPVAQFSLLLSIRAPRRPARG